MSAFADLVQLQVPGLGTVTLQTLSIGMIADVEAAVNRMAEDAPADAATNALLAFALVEPKLTAEEVSRLPDETIEALLQPLLVDSDRLRELFEATPADIPIRARFHEAIQAYIQHVFGGVAASLAASLAPTQAAWEQTLEKLGLHADMAQAAWQNVAPVLQGLSALRLQIALPDPGYWQGIAVGMEHYGQTVAILMQQFADLPTLEMAQRIAQERLPEPYLSQVMIASGMNSPLLHSPAYELPELRWVDPEDEEQVQVSAQEAARLRLVDAYDILSKVELTLRSLISSHLQQARGDKWWRQWIPEAVRKGADERKAAKEKPGEPTHHPLTYCYVHDYRAIIMRADNWRDVFEPIFGKKNECEVCFDWIGEVRDAVAHMRPIADEDYLKFTTAARLILSRTEPIA